MKIFCICLLCGFLNLIVYGQFEFEILNKKTNAPLENALIKIKNNDNNQGLVFYSDKSGKINFNGEFLKEDALKLDNPAFHIHEGKIPAINFNLSYSLLLNLASACNPDNDAVLWGFISKYQEGLSPETSPLL